MAPNPWESKQLDNEKSPLLSPASTTSDGLLSPYPELLESLTDQNKLAYSSNRSSYAELPSPLKTYRRRWWILFVFSALAFCQSWIWITWSSVSMSAKNVFGWTDTTIALLVDWGNIPFIIFVFPVCLLLDRKGLRVATVCSAFLMVLSCSIKCITTKTEIATPLIHVGQILNGIAGIILCGAPPQLSSSWFPSHQRTTATSIAVLSNFLGISFGFLIGPVFIPHPGNPNCDMIGSLSRNCKSNSTANNTDSVEVQRKQIMEMLYFELAFAVGLFFLVVAYFPRQPKLPPTASATLERLRLASTISKLVRNKNFWLIGMGYAVTCAICSNFLSVLGPALEPFGISQSEIGMMGTISTLTGSLLSLAMARSVDLLGGKIKMFLIIMWMVGCVNFIWYTLLYTQIVTPTLARLYPSIVITGIMAYSGSPLYMELCVEVAYPLQEGLVGIFLQTIFNVIGSLFLALFLIPDIGVSWMNWCLIGCTVLGGILAALQKEKYNRSDVDRAAKKLLYQSIENVDDKTS